MRGVLLASSLALRPGEMKCGTTTLYQLLAKHARISLPLTKEPRFLMNGRHQAITVGRYAVEFEGPSRDSGLSRSPAVSFSPRLLLLPSRLAPPLRHSSPRRTACRRHPARGRAHLRRVAHVDRIDNRARVARQLDARGQAEIQISRQSVAVAVTGAPLFTRLLTRRPGGYRSS